MNTTVFKSLFQSSIRSTYNLCAGIKPLNASPILYRQASSAMLLQKSNLHCGTTKYTMDKDQVKTKASVVAAARASKIETHIDGDDSEIAGFSDVGLIVPTLETHEMIVNNIKYTELPVVHIRSSPNNTIITCTDSTGKVRHAHSSCGCEGFKNVKKSSTVAAQATGLSVGYKAKRKGHTHVRVLVKGLGVGRLPAMMGLKQAGITIVSITDITPIFGLGPKPRKAKKGQH